MEENGSPKTARRDRSDCDKNLQNSRCMSFEESVTQWINGLRVGDARATQHVWEQYFQRMVELARQKLSGAPRAAADEEDVALSAFKSFCFAARTGRYPQLQSRDALWPLLMAITVHKSIDQIRGENRQKRGGTGKAHVDRDALRQSLSEVTIDQLFSKEPTPEFAAALADEVEFLLQRLAQVAAGDTAQIALLKLQGYDNREIAEHIGCSVRTVERAMVIIARIWDRESTE